MRSFHNRGIADLYQLYKHESDFMSGAAIADKVIGKGAAALLVLGDFKLVYADVISQSAHSLLQDANIETHYGKIVDHIENRSKTGWCPVESRCLNETTPEGCLKQIELFINQTNNEKNSYSMKTTEVKLYSLNYSEIRTYLFGLLFVAGNIILPQCCHLIPQGGLT